MIKKIFVFSAQAAITQRHFTSILKRCLTILLCFATFSFAVVATSAPEQKKVKVYTVITTNIFDTYKYPAVIEAKTEREMYAELTGFVQHLAVTVGAWVQKDAVLMTLKPIKTGYTEHAITIKSPFAGQVTNIAKKLGSHVKEGELLLQIVDPSQLMLKIEIPQQELRLLNVGKIGTAEFRGVSKAVPVKIAGISSFVDSTTGTASAQLDFAFQHNIDPQELAKLKQNIFPGMLGYVIFEVNNRAGVAIPNQAILHEKQQQKVRLVKAGKAIKVAVQLGKLLAGGTREIISGLQLGDIVVVSAGKYILENEAVVIEQDKPEQEQ